MSSFLECHDIDPKSWGGLFVKACIGGVVFTTASYGPEILLRRMQIGKLPEPRTPFQTCRFVGDVVTGKTSPKNSAYLRHAVIFCQESTSHISPSQRTFLTVGRSLVAGKGFGSKLLGNTALALGALTIPDVSRWVHNQLK